MTYNPLDPGKPGGGGSKPSPSKPSSGGSGHSSGGSSGSSASKKASTAAAQLAQRRVQYTEAYKAWYLTIYGKDAAKYWKDPSVQKQVKAALAGKYPASLSDFSTMVRRYDKNYLKSDEAVNNMNAATGALQDLFPGQDTASLSQLVEQSARLGWNADTLKQNVMQTEMWKKNYAYYAESGMSNPAQYQQYKTTFEQIMAQNGLPFDANMEELFFSSRITPQDFSSNWDMYKQGNPSLDWFRGQGLSGTETQAALFNQPVNNYQAQAFTEQPPTPADMNQKSKVASAYAANYDQRKNAFNQAEQAKVQAAGVTSPGQVKSALQNAFSGQKQFMASQANPFGLAKNESGQISVAGI
jgi:hypothetical protein